MGSNNPYASVGAEPIEDENPYASIGAEPVSDEPKPKTENPYASIGAEPVEDSPQKGPAFFEGIKTFVDQTKASMQQAYAQKQAQKAAQEAAQAAHDADPHFWTAEQFKKRSPKPQTPEEEATYDQTLQAKETQETQFRDQYFRQKYGFDPEKQQEEFKKLMSPDVKIEKLKPQNFFQKISDMVEKVYGGNPAVVSAVAGPLAPLLGGLDEEQLNAKRANIHTMSAYTGLSPDTVSKNYDEITKDLKLRDYPDAAELISGAMVLSLPLTFEELMAMNIAKGIAPHVAAKEAGVLLGKGVAYFTAAKESTERAFIPAAKAIAQKLRGEPVKYEVGKLQDYFPDNAKDLGSVTEFILYGMGAKGIDDMISSPRVAGEIAGIRYRILKAMGVEQPTALEPITYEQAQKAFPDHWKDLVSAKEWNRYKSDLSERISEQNKTAEEARQSAAKPQPITPEALKSIGAELIDEPAAQPERSTPYDTPEVIQARQIHDETEPTHLIQTPERQKMRQFIADEIYNRQPTPTAGGRLDIVTGLPASGKSKLFVNPIIQEHGSVLLDNDEVKNYLPEFNGHNAGAVHKESSDIVENYLKPKAIANNHNVVMPILGKNVESVKKNIIEPFRAAGYSIHLHHVDIKPEQSAERSVNRFIEGETLPDGRVINRFVDPHFILNKVGLKPGETYDKLKAEGVDSYERFSNDVPKGQKPVLLEKGTGSQRSVRPRGDVPGVIRPVDAEGLGAPSSPSDPEVKSPKSKKLVQFSDDEKSAIRAITRDVADMEAPRRIVIKDPDLPVGEDTTVTGSGFVLPYLKNFGVTKAKDIPILKKAAAGEPLTDKQHDRVLDLLGRYEADQEYYTRKAKELDDEEQGSRSLEELFGELTESQKDAIRSNRDAVLQSAREEAAKEVLADAGRRGEPETNREPDAGGLPGEGLTDFPFGENKTEPEPAGATLESAVIPGAKQFYEQDVQPFVEGTLTGIAETAKLLTRFLDPTVGVNQTALDEIMAMKGTRDKLYYELDARTKFIEDRFSKMPQEEQVAFIDRFKTGQRQPSPELQAVADMMEKIDTLNWQIAKEFKPSLAWKENHFRVMWKVIPGTKTEKGGFRGVFKRPLQGSKGFTKQSTLSDMSEGLEMGGVPYSYNPMTLFKLAYQDINKFITAQKMFQAMKDMGFAQYVRKGAELPENFVKLEDSIAKVYFPAELLQKNVPSAAPAALSHPDEETAIAEGPKPRAQVPHEMGEWYVDKGVGRILNNYLSKDHIRGSAVGRGLMWIKNNSTAVELSLSPFHAVFESLEAMGSAVGLGLSKIYNLGVVEGNAKAALSGLADILTAPVSPYTTSRIGGKAVRLMSKEDFLDSPEGQHFTKKYPEVRALLSDLFLGGGKLAIAEDYKLNTIRTFKENLSSSNYIGATLRALPALNQLTFRPLFETYIPRLKIGTFLREYPTNLEIYRKQLESGKMTRAQLARFTWQSVENRFGEMNFDNLFWNNTFKTSMQLMFRSVTWKLGSLKEYGTALSGQTKEFYNAAKEKRAPKLHPSMAWLLGVSVMTVALSNVIQGALAKKKVENTKDVLFPQVDKVGSRVSMPTYWRDIFHLMHDPLGYVKSGLSGEIGRIADIWQNKDFYGQEVYNFNDPFATKAWKAAVHLVPLPFSVSSYKSFKQQGIESPAKELGFLGFTKAPGYINQTPMQEKIFKLYGDRFGSKGSMPQADFEKQQARSRIKQVTQQAVTARKAGDMELYRRRMAEANKLTQDALKSGKLTQRGLGVFKANAQLPPDVRAFKRLPESDQMILLQQMSPEEKDKYKKYAALNVRRQINQKKHEGAADAGGA